MNARLCHGMEQRQDILVALQNHAGHAKMVHDRAAACSNTSIPHAGRVLIHIQISIAHNQAKQLDCEAMCVKAY